jgi:hypothetical protein
MKARGEETTRKTKTLVVDNIRMDLEEVIWGGVDLIGVTHVGDRRRALVNAGKLSSDFPTGGLSSSSQLHRVSYLTPRAKVIYICVVCELVS